MSATPIEPNPAATSLSKDVTVYRKLFSEHKQEVRAALKKKKPAKYPDHAPDAKFLTLDAYCDFAFDDRQNRCGGILPSKPPIMPALIAPGAPGNVKVRSDGAIIHTINGKEDDHAHDYMHLIFDYILYTTRQLLEAVNEALNTFIDDPAAAASYSAAVKAFEDFRKSLQPGGSNPFSSAFNGVDIEQIVTNEGYVVSARFQLHWKNPYHSSSTIRVP